ncbi:hypothetical protein DXG03_004956 [Asterophora parasitica]|uniref:Uncharacterized protein n=1 Tax=Asterophora parasitica TaxID=117018 RepID=A0A9P7GJW2_9AGAR|nr:hypothetical protein DXG03_004956 [Asterophora parasitica]
MQATVHLPSATSHATVPLRFGTVGHTYIPFPPYAQGFLYLHRPPSLPLIAAEIRLRLTPKPDPNLFSTGADLLRGSIPWSIHLPRIVTLDKFAPLKAQIASDGLIDGGFMDSLKLAWHDCSPRYAATETIFTLTQPFEINLKDTACVISILTTRTHGRVIFKNLFLDRRHGTIHFPYNGRLLARLEISPLPEHARPASRPPVLVLRVLKILTPIEYDTGYDLHVPIPAEGELLSKRRRGRTGPMKKGTVPMIFDVEKGPSQWLKDLQLLVE